MEPFTMQYKIYLEAEDIGQSRIHTSTSFVKNLMGSCRSIYFKNASFDDESDADEFTLRLYIEQDIHEDSCSSPEDAASFVPDMAEFLEAIAAAHSFMDMEGSFSWQYKGEKKSYQFRSESGWDYCDFEESGGMEQGGRTD